MPHITALVLAAGASRRMGQPKLTLAVNKRPMLYWCLSALSQSLVSDTVIVAGKDYQSIYAYISLLPQARTCAMVINREYSAGMASSIRIGMTAVVDASDAVLLLLADMPFIGAELIDSLLQSFAEKGKSDSIVVPVWQGRRGHPVLLGRDYFVQLSQLQGDRGARTILVDNRTKIISLAVDTPAILIDLDTKEQWRTWNNDKTCQ